MSSDAQQIRAQVIDLEIEHRDLDDVILRMSATVGRDDLQLRRLKKRKLLLKDQIIRLKMMLVPDIPA